MLGNERAVLPPLPRDIVRQVSGFARSLQAEREAIRAGALRGSAFLDYSRALVGAADRIKLPGIADAVIDIILQVQVPSETEPNQHGCHHFTPTTLRMLPALIDAAEIVPGDVVADLGCGNGRLLTLLHLCTGCQGVGIEILPKLAKQGENLLKRNSIRGIEIRHGNAVESNLSEIRTVVMYAPFYASVFQSAVKKFEARAEEGHFRIVLHGPMELFIENSAQFSSKPERLGIRRFDAITEGS